MDDLSEAFGQALEGLTVFQLPWVAFEGLFCERCRYRDCDRQWTPQAACRGLVDNGVWYALYEEAR